MELNKQIINRHIQKHEKSCTPSAVEMVLKLLGKVDDKYYEQQDFYKDYGINFSEFDKKIIKGVNFTKLFGHTRGDRFPIGDLFKKINEEVKAQRYVIISLYSGKDNNGGDCYHNHIIYDMDNVSGEYLAFTKHFRDNVVIETKNIKNEVINMKGTDVLTYTLIKIM